MATEPVQVVVLAGRENTGAFKEEPVPAEALVDVAGRPMLSWVLSALMKAGGVATCAVVAPESVRTVCEEAGALWVPPVGDLPSNLRAGVEALDPEGSIIVSSGDIPLMTSAMVERFLTDCEQHSASLHYPIAERTLCETRYPLAKRTFVKLRNGSFTGGNLVRIERRVLPKVLDLIGGVYAARKKPWRLAALVGPGILFGVLTGRLDIETAERRVSQLIGAPVKAVMLKDPELAIDVDKAEDLRLARSALQGAK